MATKRLSEVSRDEWLLIRNTRQDVTVEGLPAGRVGHIEYKDSNGLVAIRWHNGNKATGHDQRPVTKHQEEKIIILEKS